MNRPKSLRRFAIEPNGLVDSWMVLEVHPDGHRSIAMTGMTLEGSRKWASNLGEIVSDAGHAPRPNVAGGAA